MCVTGVNVFVRICYRFGFKCLVVDLERVISVEICIVCMIKNKIFVVVKYIYFLYWNLRKLILVF